MGESTRVNGLNTDSEKTITFIIPVYGNAALYLARCLHSILDQDYVYKDVIVVFDGGEEQLSSALRQRDLFKEHKEIQFFVKDHGGASSARNYGLKKATGDYVCFFDCDSILRAGAISTWMSAFDQHPDCDFVYGGYRYTMKDKYMQGVDAKPFDPWLLTCNNYISTMNPIKRSKCPMWDESLKGLQDWHFWLQVVHGRKLKGHKIDDVLVVTEPPSEDSISGETHKNHLDRYKKVRSSIGIPERETVITSFGAQFQGIRRAKFLNADYHDPFMLMYKPHEYKNIISMGYYVDTPAGASEIFKNAGENCKKIIHFIGTDVFQLSLKDFRSVRFFSENIVNFADHILCNAPWLQEELETMGLHAELLYCPIDIDTLPFNPSLPEDFTVAVYRSDTNPMYHEWFMIEIAKSCPDIKFLLFGGAVPLNLTGVPSNVKYVGNIHEKKMPEFISKTSCILRITIHDGFPASVSEWIMSGKEAICNIGEMPYTASCETNPRPETLIQDKKNVIKALRDMQRNPRSEKERIEARDYYEDLLSPSKYIQRMNKICINE